MRTSRCAYKHAVCELSPRRFKWTCGCALCARCSISLQYGKGGGTRRQEEYEAWHPLACKCGDEEAHSKQPVAISKSTI